MPPTFPGTKEGLVHFLMHNCDSEWHSFELKPMVQEIVARLSSRLFLGDELCRNRDWLDLTISFTITSTMAAIVVSFFPAFLRPLANEILPMCRKQRRDQYVDCL